MTSLKITTTTSPTALVQTEADADRPGLRAYVSFVGAVMIAVSSFATLTAFDTPLDRQALLPSVMDFMEVAAGQAVQVLTAFI